MLAQLPPMGWNSWNTFGDKINEEVVCAAADKIVELGLDKVGYKYVVIDDCWSLRERDPETGKIVADPAKFPHGMKYVADYIHSKGLLFGMYSCDGVRTCANFPASFDHEFLDARTFAEFGIDFLKYDNCFKPASAPGELLYRRMGQALRLSGREILFSACNWGAENVWSWIRSTGAHMFRSTGDIFDNFVSFRDIFLSQLDKFNTSAPGCWNDIDMLTVGMFGNGNVGTSGCTKDEYYTQFSLWCMASAPLMLGCDIRKIDPEMLALVKNPELLAIDQDPEGRPPFRVGGPVWTGGDPKNGVTLAKLLSGGDIAIAMYNFGDAPRAVDFFTETMGLPAASGWKLKMKDCVTGEVIGPVSEYVRLEGFAPHSCRVFRATPVRA